MQKVLTWVPETAPLGEGDALCKKDGCPCVSAGWPTSHFLKALKRQVLIVLTPQIQEPLTMKYVILWH